MKLLPENGKIYLKKTAKSYNNMIKANFQSRHCALFNRH